MDVNVQPLPSLGDFLSSDVNVNAPQLNLPGVDANAQIDLAKPTIDIPSVDVVEPYGKNVIRPSISFNPNIDIPGIDLETPPPTNVKIDLEHPPIDIPAVDVKEPEVKLNEKVVLPSLDELLNANAPGVEITKPQVFDIPDSTISANINLPKKIIDEPESSYEPPKIDFDTNVTDQPPLIDALLSAGPERPFVVESKANKPDINALRKKGDINIQSPSIKLEGPSLKAKGDLTGPFGTGIKADLKADLGKGKISAEKDEPKSGKKEDKKKEEPKEKPIQMKSFISQDVYAPIHPVRKIPKVKIFKGFPSKKKKK
jgi:hypothetical protein